MIKQSTIRESPEVKKFIKNAHRCKACKDIVDWPKKFCDVACEHDYKLQKK